MARGIRRHLKRVAAPSHWMLDKLRGQFAPKPIAGPHKLRECIPLVVMLRNRLKYALTYNEAKAIMMQRLVKVDNKVRTDLRFPAGFMDVVTIEKTGENFRLMYDLKGRFLLHKVGATEASYKLCSIKKVMLGAKGVPQAMTHDGRTLRYVNPDVQVNDTVRINLESGEIEDHVKFENGNICTIRGGKNIGRVGILHHIERHPGSFNIAHVKDAAGHSFATRLQNVFILGKGNKAWISLGKGEGVKLNNMEDRAKRMQSNAKKN